MNIVNVGSIIGKVKRNKILVSNFFYMTLLQVFLLIAPLITYPYLVNILGMELYGLIITAQILASYATIIIDFGSNSVCAKHVSVNRDNTQKLSEIVSSILTIRSFLWIICFIVYMSVVYIVPDYRKYWLLFLLTYGITLNDVLFPQYFFQGIEQMKYTTIVNIFFKLLFIVLVFFIVKEKSDYLWVPVFYTLGYIIGGVYSLQVIFRKMKVKYIIPTKEQLVYYIKDSMPLFATDLVCTIKDKFNYLLLGTCVGMSSVVIYDLGMKIYGIAARPAGIINLVFFPRSAKTKNLAQFRKVLFGIIVLNIFIITMVNLFLPYIVDLFIHKSIDLLPVRIFTIAPLFSTVGAFIMSNMCIAYGYNKYALYSILMTTFGYLIILTTLYFTNNLNNLFAFVLLMFSSYFIEFLYRIYAYYKISKTSNR